MEMFLAISVLIFIFFGSILLFVPAMYEKCSKYANISLFNIEGKVLSWRIPIGILFLVLSTYLLLIVLLQ